MDSMTAETPGLELNLLEGMFVLTFCFKIIICFISLN